MNTSNMMSDEILNQAGRWLLEMQSPGVPAERVAAWQQWLAGHEQHARAFDQLQRTWLLADRLGESQRDALPWPTAAELAADPSPQSQRSQSRAFIRNWAIAATLTVIAVGLSFWLTRDPGTQSVQTLTGKHRELRLSDGSLVSVGAGSRLRVTLEPDRRLIQLERGEAFFQVAKDASRPFSVRAGSMAITAIGTAFNVRRTGELVVVGVSEGTVAVSRTQKSLLARINMGGKRTMPLSDGTHLAAGQRLVLEPDAPVPPAIEAIAPPSVGSWRAGRLQYSGEPLSFVIADIARYIDTPIVIADSSIAGLRITGTVSEQNIESWLTSLQSALPVEVSTRDDGRLEIRRRNNER